MHLAPYMVILDSLSYHD